MVKTKTVYKYRRKSYTKSKRGSGAVVPLLAVGGLIIGALYLSGGSGGLFKVLSDAAGTASQGLAGALESIGIGTGAGIAGKEIIKGVKSGGGGSDSSKGGSKPSKPSSGDDFSNVKDPFSNENLGKVGPATAKDIPKAGGISSRFSGDDSVAKRQAVRDAAAEQNKKAPSKTDRSKKSDTKKTHKTNDKPKAGDTKTKAPVPEPSCDIICQAGKGVKDLWERISGQKSGSYLEDLLKPGLEAPKIVPLG